MMPALDNYSNQIIIIMTKLLHDSVLNTINILSIMETMCITVLDIVIDSHKDINNRH